MRKIMLVLFIMITIVTISTMCFATTIEGENNIETYNETSVINGESNSSIIRCEIKVVTPENGGIYPNGRVRVKKGNNQKFTFVPDDGYELSKILVDGEEVDVFDFDQPKNLYPFLDGVEAEIVILLPKSAVTASNTPSPPFVSYAIV